MSADRSLERLANATLLVPFEAYTPPRWLLDGLADGFAGVCVFHNNIESPEQIAAVNARIGEAAQTPLISLDEEGGDVTRIGQRAGSGYPGNAALGAVDDPELTRSVHRSLAAELHGLGFNLDLAPAVDVNTAADNPVIGTRSFGSDAALVARHSAAAVTGLQEGGVVACAKHFPGHGSTHQDSHEVLPVVDADARLLAERELLPFRAAIDAGVLSVLSAHIELPGLGIQGPATLSAQIMTDLLRGELGFSGMLVSDALDMAGVSQDIGVPEAAVRALAAGCDLLCLGRFAYAEQVAAVRAAIVAAVREGRLSGERLEEAADRTGAVRDWIRGRTGTPAAAEPGIGLDSARRAVRVVGEFEPLRAPYIIEVDAPAGIAVGEVPWGLSPWFPRTVRLSAETADVAALLAEAAGYDLVVVVRDAHRYPATRALVDRLCRARPDCVVVEMGLPVWRPDSRAHISTYGAAHVNSRSAAELLGLTWAVPVR